MPGGPQLLAAAEQYDGLWLVGGAVRDMLLGHEPRELDVLVENELEEVARSLGEPVFHERFGTATVETGTASYDLAPLARRATRPRVRSP